MTLLIERVDQSGEESFFAFPRGAITALTAPLFWVEQVSEGISKHAYSVDDKAQRQTRPYCQPGPPQHIRDPFRTKHAPQLGVGGGMPRPRKLRLASERMIPGTIVVYRTMMGAMILGRIWRISTLEVELPIARAASRYKSSLVSVTK